MRSNLIFLVLSLIIFFEGCKKEDSNPVDSNNISNVISISGKFENWNQGTDKILKITIRDSTYHPFGQSTIDVNGNFSISSMDAVPDYMLNPINSVWATPGLVFSNSSTKINKNKVRIQIFSGNSSVPYFDNEIEKEFIQSSSTYTTGDFYIKYVYLDNAVNVSGTYTESTYEYNYNLKFKKGWNAYCVKINEYNPTSFLLKQELTTDIPEGGKWVLK